MIPFGWVNFKENGKKERAKWRKNDNFVCLVRSEREKEN